MYNCLTWVYDHYIHHGGKICILKWYDDNPHYGIDMGPYIMHYTTIPEDNNLFFLYNYIQYKITYHIITFGYIGKIKVILKSTNSYSHLEYPPIEYIHKLINLYYSYPFMSRKELLRKRRYILNKIKQKNEKRRK